MQDSETNYQDKESGSVDEQIAELCHDAMSELQREYGSHHPICECVREQIKTMHLHHTKRKDDAKSGHKKLQ